MIVVFCATFLEYCVGCFIFVLVLSLVFFGLVSLVFFSSYFGGLSPGFGHSLSDCFTLFLIERGYLESG